MSFTVQIDIEKLNQPEILTFQMEDNTLTVERVISLIRSGFQLEGGFLSDFNNQIIFNLKDQQHYKFIRFKHCSDANVTTPSASNSNNNINNKIKNNINNNNSSQNSNRMPVQGM